LSTVFFSIFIQNYINIFWITKNKTTSRNKRRRRRWWWWKKL